MAAPEVTPDVSPDWTPPPAWVEVSKDEWRRLARRAENAARIKEYQLRELIDESDDDLAFGLTYGSASLRSE